MVDHHPRLLKSDPFAVHSGVAPLLVVTGKGCGATAFTVFSTAGLFVLSVFVTAPTVVVEGAAVFGAASAPEVASVAAPVENPL